MKDELLAHLRKTASILGIDPASAVLDYPEHADHGDFSTNIALSNAKALKANPKALAEKIVETFKKEMPDTVASVEIAGAGFINFKLKDKVFTEQIIARVDKGEKRGWSGSGAGKKIMVEYTDPNPFKIFHIGHLMANAIGESVSRLVESSGAEVVRACYQGDVGLHVAKTIWGVKYFHSKNLEKFYELKKNGTILEKIQFLGNAYVTGSGAYDENDLSGSLAGGPDKTELKNQVHEINKIVFTGKGDQEVLDIYQEGRKWSLEYFDLIYARLGTKFDRFFFESEVADSGVAIVKEFLKKGVFAESEGAVVFKGEDRGLHTRVFITSNGLPTYETKELGLNTEKFKLYPNLDQSIIVTANEQNEYFKVLLKAFHEIDPSIAEKTRHMSHGLMRFASGKMSSRKGNIISAESLIDEIKALVMEKMMGRELSADETDEISDEVAIAAIKYTILRQAIGGDVIFDSAKSISFEGDSGPYLQYSAVRAGAVLEKAEKEGGGMKKGDIALPEQAGLLEKLIIRFPDIAEHARTDYAPQHIATYLINLAGAFNGFYGNQVIVDKADELSPYYIALTSAFRETMIQGLWLLGIKVPKKM